MWDQWVESNAWAGIESNEGSLVAHLTNNESIKPVHNLLWRQVCIHVIILRANLSLAFSISEQHMVVTTPI